MAANFNIIAEVCSGSSRRTSLMYTSAGTSTSKEIRNAVAIVVFQGAIVQIALVRHTVGVAVATGLVVNVAAIRNAAAVAVELPASQAAAIAVFLARLCWGSDVVGMPSPSVSPPLHPAKKPPELSRPMVARSHLTDVVKSPGSAAASERSL